MAPASGYSRQTKWKRMSFAVSLGREWEHFTTYLIFSALQAKVFFKSSKAGRSNGISLLCQNIYSEL